MRPFDIEAIRAEFPILGRTVYGRPLVYLDNAATTQKPVQVVRTMEDMLLRVNANVHRAGHLLAAEATEMYEAARDTVAAFIGAGEREEVVFTSGATAALNMVARGLCELLVGEGDNVVISEAEHHSNIVPWQMAMGSRGELRVLPVGADGRPEVERLEELVDERTRVVAITQCSNVLGAWTDLQRVVEVARRHGAVVVVDGAQGIVHGGVNVNELGCDFYAFSGHKLYGPTGTGVLWGRRELLERLPPMMGGGEMVAPQGVTFTSSIFAELPYRLEAGTPNYVGAVGLAEAIRWLGEFDAEEVARHEAKLREVAVAELLKINGLKVYGADPDGSANGSGDGKNSAPIVAFNVEGVHSADLGQLLDKQGIAVRTGTLCAQPLVERLEEKGTGGVCRASMAIYNTEQEVVMLAQAVRKAVEMLCR